MRILQVAGKAREFLCDIVMAEVQEVGKSVYLWLYVAARGVGREGFIVTIDGGVLITIDITWLEGF